MSYKIMNRKDFLKYIDDYLKENPTEIAEPIQFNCLSDLYSFFTHHKNFCFSPQVYQSLAKQLASYNIDVSSLMTFNQKYNNYSITENNIEALELFIKDYYISHFPFSTSDSDKSEQYKLAVIVNKKFPEEMAKLIKEPPSYEVLKKQIEFIKKQVESTISVAISHHYSQSQSEFKDISGLIYMVFRNMYPNLDIYIPGRSKSADSTIKNIRKEIRGQLSDLMPTNFETGISDSDLEKQFNLTGAKTDLSGCTIVLSNTNDVLHFELNDPSTADILALRKTRTKNIDFIHSLENYLSNKSFFSDDELMQIQIQLLIRLRDSTFEQCTEEYIIAPTSEPSNDGKSGKKPIKTSFTRLLEKKCSEYKQNNVLDVDINDVYALLEELKDRVHDKYQFKLLEKTIPDVLASEDFKDLLGVKSQFVKKVIRKNGYVALFYYLTTSDGQIIEIQAQSYKRYHDSKKGPSDHNLLEGKQVDIDLFFEPSSENIDEKTFKKNLNILKETTIHKKNYLLSSQDSQLSYEDVRSKRQLKAALNSIKLKEKLDFPFEYVDKNGNHISEIYSETIEKYLPKFAAFHSPDYSFVVSSPHTRMNSNVAGYNEKSLVTNFRNVLLQSDCTSCLAQILIEKLEDIVGPEINTISRNGIVERAHKKPVGEEK